MTMNKILAAVLVTFLAFAVTVLVFNAQGLQVQDSLINMFLGTIATELVAMGGIKAFKFKYEKRNKKAGD